MRDSSDEGEQLVDPYLQPYGPHDINVEILALFAKEMDDTRRDKRFKAPFQPLRTKNSTVENDDGFLMDGAPLPSAIRRRTWTSDNARSVGGSEDY